MTETERYSALMSVYDKEKSRISESQYSEYAGPDSAAGGFCNCLRRTAVPGADRSSGKFRAERPQLFQIVPLEKNGGLGPALNEGMKYCKYSLIARMDSDDISMPKRCEKQLACMEDGDYALVGGTVMNLTGRSRIL